MSPSPSSDSTEPDARTAAVYGRKSDPDDRGINDQIQMAVRAAKSDGYQVPEGPNHRFADNDVSGARLSRPGFDTMVEVALSDQTPFSRIYVPDKDRWGRWDDPRERYFFEVLLERHGITVQYLKGNNPDLEGGVQEEDVGALLEDFVDTLFASKERRKTRWRVSKGIRARFIEGFWPHPTAPYGTRRWLADEASGECLAPADGPQPSEVDRASCRFRLKWATDGSKEVVAKIFRWIDEEGASYRAIAEQLNEQEVVPPSGEAEGEWLGTSVARLARNPIYRGDAVLNRTVSDEEPVLADEASRDPDEGRPILYRNFMPGEPPVSRERFASVQAIVEQRNEQGHGRGPKAKYLLSGILRCGHCGGPFTRHTSTRQEQTRRTYYRHDHRRECPETDRSYLRTSTIDEAVLGQLFDGLGEDFDERVERELARLRGQDRSDERQQRLSELEDGIQEDREALQQLQTEVAYASTEERREAIRRSIEAVEDRLEQKKQAREELQAEAERAGELARRRDDLEDLLTEKVELLRGASPERRKSILQTLLEEIRVFPDQKRLEIVSRAL